MRVYDIDEKEKFTRYLDYRYQLIFRTGLATGLRISDIVKLEKRILDIKNPTVKEQKTGKSKRIYIPAKLRKELRDYSTDHEKYIFESKSKSGHITRQAVWKHFKLTAKKIHITTNVGTHSMRKGYAKKLELKGKSYTYIKNKLNHQTLSDTLLYLLNER